MKGFQIQPGCFDTRLHYAELHDAPLGFSCLSEAWPEIYIDLPWRVQQAAPLPLLMTVADAHLYPVSLQNLSIKTLSPSGEIKTWPLNLEPISLQKRIEGFHLTDLHLEERGEWLIWVDAEAHKKGQAPRCFRNQLAKAFPEIPLRTRVEEDALPQLPGLVQGDPHVHGSATQDRIEFGPPPQLLRRAASTLGLDFFALTDHSYDLNRGLDDSKIDTSLPRFRAQQEWIQSTRKRAGPFVIAGEECSIEGLHGGILHALILNPKRFYAGNSDGGESFIAPKAQWKLRDLVEELKGSPSLCISAHTAETPGVGERLLLRRRAWTLEEMRLLELHQVLSGSVDDAFRLGLQHIESLILQGQSPAMIAGNDSHGHFSLGRSVRLPWLLVGWGRKQLFGRYRTQCVLDESEKRLLLSGKASDDEQNDLCARLFEQMRSGRCALSDGPLLYFEGRNSKLHLGGACATWPPKKTLVHLPKACGAAHYELFGESHGKTICFHSAPLPTGESEQTIPTAAAQSTWLRAELQAEDGFASTGYLLRR
jgi:hypothetical protein